MTRARTLLLAGALTALGPIGEGCWLKGPGDLEALVNVEVLVSGLADGDRLLVDIDGDVSRHVFDRDAGRTLRLVTTLDQGRHRLVLVIERPPFSLCGVREFIVDEEGASVSVDARDLVDCDETRADAGEPAPDAGPSDAGRDEDGGDDDGGDGDGDEDGGDGDGDGDGDEDGGDGDGDEDGGDGDGDEDGGDGDGDEDAGVATVTLDHVRELRTLPCGDAGTCETMTTTIDGDGDVTWIVESTGDTESGEADALDLAALVEALLSQEADALFEGEDPSCPVEDAPPDAPTVRLYRTVRVDDGSGGDELSEREVDATGCDGGIAGEITARIALIRALAIDAGE